MTSLIFGIFILPLKSDHMKASSKQDGTIGCCAKAAFLSVQTAVVQFILTLSRNK